MARIRDADVARVRDASSIVDVVGEHVQLRPAGTDRMKGLCPFHEERTPSFHVRPSAGLMHCFGCGVGGDVIHFLRELEQLTFVEAVEKLASRAGVQLTYEQGGSAAGGRQTGVRQRLLEAHRAAEEWFASCLSSPGAAAAREFLSERGFDAEAAARFGVGYAPPGWDTTLGHLRSRGFRDAELLEGGLVSPGRRGPLDRFRDRLVWPIRDRAGLTIGFGARRLSQEDTGPKYLNTPETPLYRKSSVLYGLDLAKKSVAERMQVVVVEGYTDVMACHLAGVTTAVATCGTAFGHEHVELLRPVMRDSDELRGEVVFTFDGDAAGQKAALRAFEEDQAFAAQTFVAVERSGADPCDLRLRSGDAAVRDLVARRVPLFEFVVRTTVARHDLETVEGREAALRAAVPVVARIKDRGLRDPYALRLAGWLGHPDETEVLRRVREVAGDPGRRGAPGPRRERPAASDGAAEVEREVLKLALQVPGLAGTAVDAVEPAVFRVPEHAAVHAAVVAAGGVRAAGEAGPAGWPARVSEHLVGGEAGDASSLRRLVNALAVEPFRTAGEVDDRYVRAQVHRVRELQVTRELVEAKGRLQRMSPVADAESYRRAFARLVALEQERRSLREVDA